MKNKINSDWLKEFPEYKKIGSGNMKKIYGPILMSVWYSFHYGKEYRPTSCICNLLNAPDHLYAALSFEPRSRRSDLTWPQHEKGLYLEAVQELKNDGPLPLEGPLTLSQVLDAYKKYRGTGGFFQHELEDPSLILAWAGKIQRAKQVAEENFEGWHQRLLDKYKDLDNPIPINPLDFLKEFLPRLESQQALQKQLEEQIIRFKLDKIPRYDLIIDVD